ncbi:spindle assembly checkpoint component Mad1 [Mycena rosella]|uniref:Spindle assembly checkpoint component MAD1 n=1 Tax=Mycena rosella TaxID=1033263 RepID=A0AAD7GR35_MYCRO|nr:spindle assembly checkpoint component Mad1 [Mycena rosella]
MSGGTPSFSRQLLSASTSRTPVMKRDSLAAELERDPHLSSAKRQQRTQAFTSNMAHAALERQLAAAQTTRMELETKLRERDMLVEKLERDRRWFSDREQEERDEKERERAENAEQTERKDTELRTLRSNLTTLREELADLTDAHASLGRSTAQTIASQKSQITTLTRQTTLLEEEVSQFKLLAEERSQTIDDIQVQFQELSTAPTPGNEQENSDMAVVREELHRQASYLRTLEATNARLTAELAVLRERHTSIEVLREEKRGLERKLQPLEALRERVVRLEAQVEAGRQEREKWARSQETSVASTSTPPISVTHNLSALRLQHAQLLEDHGATSALLRAKEAELADAEQRAAEAQDTIERLESEVGILTGKAARSEQRASLADREVGFMKALVSSYSLEEANKELAGAAVDGASARTEQVQQLEALLEEYKTVNTRLSQQVNDAARREPAEVAEARAHELDTERAARSAAQEALDAAVAETKAQAETIERLEQELFDLGGEIAGGRHVPPGVRVLSFVDTPDLLVRDAPQAREAETARVRGENAALLAQIGALQAGGAHADASGSAVEGEHLVPRESWDAVCKERDELLGMVRQKETRLKRLKEVFASKADEFKESIAALLGVKLAFFQSGQVRVTSLYDLSTTFVFKPASAGGGNMQLVAQGEGGPEDLPNMMAYWVGKEQCIPGFLASVTLEVYDRWKRERGEAT